MKGPFRADHVGSLLRPEALLEKREEWKADKISDADLREYENECIASIVKQEEKAGIKSVTDGEYRRESFHFDFINQISGIETNFTLKSAFAQGEKTKAGGEKAVPLTVEITDRMTLPAEGIGVENYKYLASIAGEGTTPKVTMPSPTIAAPNWFFGRWMTAHGSPSKSIRVKSAQPHKAYIGLRPKVSDRP